MIQIIDVELTPPGLNDAAVALKPKVLTARELEEQQREAAKSEEIVKAKASHRSAFPALNISRPQIAGLQIEIRLITTYHVK